MPHEADAIVVLGCRALPTGRPGAALARRAEAAARAYHEGRAPLVVASGGRRWAGHAEARVIARALAEHGVPRSAVREELWSLSTHENAIASAAVVRGAAGRERPRVLVVTCAWHVGRAVSDFEAVGVEAVAVGAPGPAAGLLARAWRWGHEVVCRRLDAASLARGASLGAGARHVVTTGARAG